MIKIENIVSYATGERMSWPTAPAFCSQLFRITLVQGWCVIMSITISVLHGNRQVCSRLNPRHWGQVAWCFALITLLTDRTDSSFTAAPLWRMKGALRSCPLYFLWEFGVLSTRGIHFKSNVAQVAERVVHKAEGCWFSTFSSGRVAPGGCAGSV